MARHINVHSTSPALARGNASASGLFGEEQTMDGHEVLNMRLNQARIYARQSGEAAMFLVNRHKAIDLLGRDDKVGELVALWQSKKATLPF